MEMSELVGKQFTIKGFPVLYVILGVTLEDIKVKAVEHNAKMALPIESFLSAYRTGEISFIGEPVFGIKKPVVEETPEEDEPSNYFSFDDL